MGLSRLDNFLKSARGTILYVDPNSLDSTDSIENSGNSLTRPFKTIQRALIEAARFSYQRGLNNDRFNKTTILLYPGDHVIDNRPGYIPTGTGTYSERSGITGLTDLGQWNSDTVFDLTTPNNPLYKLNSVYGGVIVPRGTSIVGIDLRKTRIRPTYVPNPENDDIERSAIFRVTGGCYLWQFTILDADPNGTCYKDYTNNIFVPNFSHHKLSGFEYADGVNTVTIQDDFLTYNESTSGFQPRTDLDMYYEKVAAVYGSSSGREIQPDYDGGTSTVDIQPVIDEYRIVGPKGASVGITSIRAGGGTIPTATTTITVDLVETIEGLSVDSPIQISGVSAAGYDGQFVISSVLSDTRVTYKVQNIPTNPLPSVTASTLDLVVDTVTSASPYIFNISLRSVYGMCGLLADGDKATGFKSMVVAQYTGIGLQKDDNAFVRYDTTLGDYKDSTTITNLHTDSRSRFKPSYENFHIKATNDAFLQLVSVFAIGYAQHFVSENGGDLAINNSNSNFGAKALVSSGFRKEAFSQDDHGYITHIIPPKEIDPEEISVEFNAIDVGLTTSKSAGAGTTSRLYLYNETNQDAPPKVIIDGYHVGAKQNEQLSIQRFVGGALTAYSSKVVMPDGSYRSTLSSSEKSFNVGKSVTGINSIGVDGANIVTLAEPHSLINGESIRVIADDGNLPDGLEANQVYYTSTVGITTDNQIYISKTLSDAINGTPIAINNKGGTLKIVSRVSDKNAGDIGHPVQWDTAGYWYVGVSTLSNGIYDAINSFGVAGLGNATTRSYVTRKSDSRSLIDTLYRVRYVIPRNAPTTARPPIDGFVLQESNNIVGSGSSEITQLYNTSGSIAQNALRNPKFIASASWSSNVVTIRSEVPHELKTGDQVEIKNVSPIGYNGTYTVTSIISSKEFTYTLTGSNPGTFANDTSVRDEDLPYFRRKKYEKTYQVYRTQEIQPYIANVQDGVYYLTLINHSNSPTVAPFREERFAQPVENLYPQTNNDNPDSDPDATDSHALPASIGKVVVNDPQKSITKETLESFVVGYGITNIQSSSGTAHTIYTSIDHGLAGITSVSIVSGGSAYGSGSSGVLYNARLVGFAGSTTGSNATARIVVNGSGVITGVNIIDGGSAYGIGNTLTVVGVATTTSHVVGVVRVETISDNVGDTIKVTGVSSESYSGYNTLYRISGITTGKAKEINVTSAETITVIASSGIGSTLTSNAGYLPTGKVVGINTILYNSVTGLATAYFASAHGFRVDNKVSVRGANESVFNGDFVIEKFVDKTELVLRIGIETSSTSATGTLLAYRPTLTSYGGDLVKDTENTSGRLNYQYAGITTTIGSSYSITTTSNLNIPNAVSLGLKLGDYLIIDHEIFRVKDAVTSDSVGVYRAVLGSPRQFHENGSIVRRIKVTPVELRRNSIIRASGHTFEYLGFGPGNYSTSLPDKQNRALSNTEKFLSQATKTDGGIVVYTGMNSDGDFFAGNKKINSATGKEETFDTPVPTNTGEKDTSEIVNITDTQKLFVESSIKIEGGKDKNVVSEFDGPVVFNNKVTTNADIEANSFFIQGDEEISREITISDQKPVTSGNYGDIKFNSIAKKNRNAGWIYTVDNEWTAFGWVNDNLYGVGVSTNGTNVGLSTLINFTGSGIEITSSYDSNSGISTLNFNVTAVTSGYSDTAGIATYAETAGIATYAATAGIATYAATAGIATYAATAGIATYAENIKIHSTDGNSGDTTTFVTLVGNNAIGFQTSFIDSNLSYNASAVTLSSINFAGNLLGNATSSDLSSVSIISGYANVAGIATYAVTAGIATYANVAGIATYAVTAGIATYANVAGIATYAVTAGIATNLQGGLASQIPYQSTTNTTAFIPNGTTNQILRSNGTSAPSWTSNLSVGIITANQFRGGSFFGDGSGLYGITASGTGIVIRDNGVTVGTAGTIDFGDRLSVSSISSGICTITSSDSVSFASAADTAGYAATAGIATYAITAGIATNVTLANESSDTECFITFSNVATGNNPLKTNVLLKYNSISDILTVSTVNGVANVSNQIKTRQNFANINHFLTFVDSDNTSATPENLYTYSTIYFNPVQGTLSAPTFVGNLLGNASTATTATTATTANTANTANSATNANNINISATSSTDTTTSLVLVGNQSTGNQSPFIDSGLTYNANTDSLTSLGSVTATTITSNLAPAGLSDLTYGVLQGDGNIVSNIALNESTYAGESGKYCFAIRRGSNPIGIFNIIAKPSNVRIQTDTIGDGIARDLIFNASIGKDIVSGKSILPEFDNVHSLGRNGFRWAGIWSTNGSIQTSDQRDKTQISESNLGLNFIQKLNPVSYKWVVGKNEVEEDETGKVIKVTSVPGKRTHYGLLAQEVQKAYTECGVTDFAGWVLSDKEDQNSQQSLRYSQFIAPMIKAIQEQQKMIEDLKNEIEQLKKNIQ